MRFRISRAGSYGLLCTGVTAGLWLLDFYHSGVSTIVSISVFLSILKQAILSSESKWKHQGWPFRINPVRTTTALSRYHKIFFTILVRVILLHPNAKAQISNRFFSFIIEEQSNRVAREVHDTLFFSQEREGEPWIRKAGSRLCGMWFLIPGSGQC